MRIFVDLDTNQIVTQPGTPQAVTRLDFKRSTFATVEVQFCRSGQIIELPIDAAGVFGIKIKGKYDDDYVTAGLAWIKSGTGTDTVYRFIFTLITTPLNALFLVDDNINNDVATLTLMSELQWTTGGSTFKTQTVDAVIANDVNRYGDIVPVLPPIIYGVFLPSIESEDGGNLVGSVSVEVGGSYSSKPTAAVSGGTGAGTTLATRMGVSDAPAITAPGTGYTANDILTLVGGTGTAATLIVDTVNGLGAITAVSILTPGVYSALPTSPVSVTGGTGSGATFTPPTWTVVSVVVTAPGDGYDLVVPDVVFSGGGEIVPAEATAHFGTQIHIDAIPTVDLQTGVIIEVLIEVASVLTWETYVLTAGISAGAGVVTPLDWDGTTNNRRWRGAVGPSGPRGSKWYAGSTVPSDVLGLNDDFYLRHNGDIYKKASGTWGSSITNIKGATGDVGPIGTASGFGYEFDSSTTASNPGVGTLRFDASTFALATNLYINIQNIEAKGVDSLLLSLTTDDFIVIKKKAAPDEVFVIGKLTGAVVDNTGWLTIPIALTNYPTPTPTMFTDADDLSIEINSKGGGGGGGGSGFAYVFDDDTSGSNPGTNKISFDTGGLWSGITQINVHDELADTTYLGGYFPTLALLNFIIIRKGAEFGIARLDAITDHTGYTALLITDIASTAFFELTDGDAITIEMGGLGT